MAQIIITSFCLFVQLTFCQDGLSTIDWSRLNVTEKEGTFVRNIQRLYNELFITREYRSDLSPIFGAQQLNLTGETVPKYDVLVSLQYIQLLGIDAQSQLVSSAVEIEYTYTDLRLVWNISDYGGVDAINVRTSSLWTPANGISNAKTMQVVYQDSFNTGMIYANGSVVTSFEYYLETSCILDVRVFPFDEQICPLDFFNDAYNYDFIRQSGALFTKYDQGTTFDNGEWVFTNITMSYSITNYNLPKYDLLEFELGLKRKPKFYVFVIAIPCFLLTLLSIWGMFWSGNNKEEQLSKLSIGLTSMMSMTIFVQMLSDEIPRNSIFPLLGWFVIIDVILVSIACVVLVTLPFEKQPSTKSLESGGFENWLIFLKKWTFSQHFLFFFSFQTANIVNFIVFMSYWK